VVPVPRSMTLGTTWHRYGLERAFGHPFCGSMSHGPRITFYQAATLCRWLRERKKYLRQGVLFGSGAIVPLNTHTKHRTVPTIKEQAATARAAGLKRFTADRPCKRGHVVRRADAKGTCITCDYLRNSAQ